MNIRPMPPEHWPAVKAIYEAGLATGQASFQTNAPSWEEWDKSHLTHSRLVALHDDTVTGWAALTPVSGRCVYAGVAEVSVYIDPTLHGQGIFPENTASIRLHEGAGFRPIGIREKIGKMGDRWRDTALLERRSTIIGL